MQIGRFAIERKFLDSRVARRLFGIVAASALFPVAAFAVFSYVQVRGQLEADASHALRSAAKESSVAIIERLLLADEALRLHVRDVSRASNSSAPPQKSRALRSVRMLAPDDRHLAHLGDSDRARLAAGKAVLLVDAETDPYRLVLLRRAVSSDPSQGTWLAQVEATFLFQADRHLPDDRFWIRDSRGRKLFSSPRSWHPPPSELAVTDVGGSTTRASLGGEESLVVSWRLFPQRSRGDGGWIVSMSRPLDAVHRPLREFEAVFPWIVGITLCVAFGLTLSQIRRTLEPIDALTRGARQIALGEFDARVDVATGDEFEVLAEAFNQMSQVIGIHVRVLATMNTIGAALSAESDTDRLIELILRGSMRVTHASAGVLFLLTEEEHLRASQMCLGGDRMLTGAQLGGLPAFAPAERCLERRVIQRDDDLSHASDEERSQRQEFERHLGQPITSYLALPMCNEKDEATGVLVLVHSGDTRFSEEDAALAQSLASQAAVAVRKNHLVDSFRGLFEGVVQLTVNAIDAKSPHTGDHCRKVPILTEIIADAACADQVGALKDFGLTEDERYELRIAALLHDCGKVVTPVHVMDKATKLETIYDRIEVVETRFENLRLDARIRSLTRQLAQWSGPLDVADDPELCDELAAIENDLEFLKKCNVGGERMAEADRDRVRDIAARRCWKSTGEKVGYALEDDDVTNLVIQRGTLNQEEREIIEEHVVLTMRMLEALPWPRELRDVPAVAGAHHERVDGTGYPLHLRGDELSMRARILGLADIFEALTARTRPYKPGRTLTETLEILDAMSNNGHIDRGLLDLFVNEKLYLGYAAEYLSPEQIDPAHQADIESLTGPALPFQI